MDKSYSQIALSFFMAFHYQLIRSQCALFLISENITKSCGFLFSGGRERVHRKEWVNRLFKAVKKKYGDQKPNPLIHQNFLKNYFLFVSISSI